MDDIETGLLIVREDVAQKMGWISHSVFWCSVDEGGHHTRMTERDGSLTAEGIVALLEWCLLKGDCCIEFWENQYHIWGSDQEIWADSLAGCLMRARIEAQ